MPGLLINGKEVTHPLLAGIKVFNQSDFAWCKLNPGDFRLRDTGWIRQLMLHATKGAYPQYVIPGAGPGGRGKHVADFWNKDPEHSAAQIVVDRNGDIYVLADLARVAAYHATMANEYSVGIEMYQELPAKDAAHKGSSGIYAAVIESTARLVMALCDLLGIPFVGPSKYNNGIIKRMVSGGPDMAGVFGHRDVAWDFKKKRPTRGRGDPGDIIFDVLNERGRRTFDYDATEDLRFFREVQSELNAKGEKLRVDGVVGPSTVAAMRRHGMWGVPLPLS
jgi:N-acetylmuramoyl-L-alanine amidase